jgi:two-component system response regulator ResD
VAAGTLSVDRATREVRVRGVRVTLSQKEYELLLRLADEPRRVFTKAELLRDVWHYQASARTRTLDAHASRLRRKLRDADPATPFVENVWGVGYRLVGAMPEG